MPIDNMNLPDECYAYISPDGEKMYPYKDKTGKIDLPMLRNSLQEAAKSKFGDKAIPKLKSAAKQMKIGEYAESWKGGEGFFRAEVQITNLREQLRPILEKRFITNPESKPNDEKREIIVPLLIQGWGNEVDNNYYSAKAVTESASYLQSRRKMYINHSKKGSDERDIRDWGASIQETWVDTLPNEKQISLGRVKILDNWLWERAKIAPDEIATSLLGRGKAKRGIIDGKEGNIIESIEYVRSCDFVDYGGNVPFGMVSFVENDKQENNNKQEAEMLITELTLGMIKESRPELIVEIEKVAIQEKDKKINELEIKVKEQEKSNTELKAEIDAIKIKEQMAVKSAQKKEIITKCLKESKLPEAAKTEVFLNLLTICEESKVIVEGKEKIVTIEEQVKTLIADREAILGIVNPIKNMGAGKKIEEGDREIQDAVNYGIFGLEPKKEEKK